MTSAIEVLETNVNNREVIAFRKLYNGEEHEVFAPKNQAMQILFNLLATVNDRIDDPQDEYVLVRKRQLGFFNE